MSRGFGSPGGSNDPDSGGLFGDSNCGECDDFQRYIEGYGMAPCTDPRCRQIMIIPTPGAGRVVVGAQETPAPPAVAQEGGGAGAGAGVPIGFGGFGLAPQVQQQQQQPQVQFGDAVGTQIPDLRFESEDDGDFELDAPAPTTASRGTRGSSSVRATGTSRGQGRPRGTGGRPKGAKNKNQASKFRIIYNPLPVDPSQRTATGRVFHDHLGQPVLWTGIFTDITTPTDRANKPGKFPKNHEHDWKETSYAFAAPRGCIDGEVEPEANYKWRQEKWAQFVRACQHWNKMFILEQMGADRRSFPHIDAIHGSREKGIPKWKQEFQAETEKPGGWKGPWPPGVYECQEAFDAPKPNLVKCRCNKCKENGNLECSWSRPTCQYCLDNGYQCVRDSDYKPREFPKELAAAQDPQERKRKLHDQRKADQAAAVNAERGQAKREDRSRSSTAPYEIPGRRKTRAQTAAEVRGPGPVRTLPLRPAAAGPSQPNAPLAPATYINPSTGQPERQPNAGNLGAGTTDEVFPLVGQDEDAIYLARSRSRIHQLIQHYRLNYPLWTNEAEDITTWLHDWETGTEFHISSLEELGGDSQRWLNQFPQEARDLILRLENVLIAANQGYEQGSLVDRNGFNTLRQRRSIVQRRKYTAQQFQTGQPPLSDRWKCARCYHLSLPCNADTNNCYACAADKVICQRSQQFTAEMRRTQTGSAQQAQGLTNLQSLLPVTAPQNLGAPYVDNPLNPWTPCQNRIRGGNTELCTSETPCTLCDVLGFSNSCRPGAVEDLWQPDVQGIPNVAAPAEGVFDDVPSSWSQVEQDPGGIFNGGQPPRFDPELPGLIFDTEFTPFTPAGEPNPGLYGQTPAETATPNTPADIFDPEGLLNTNDEEPQIFDPTFGFSQAIAAMGIDQDPSYQIEPRFPLADDRWDDASFNQDVFWDDLAASWIRAVCLWQIVPDEPNPSVSDGCDELQLPTDKPSDDFKCHRKPVEKCKYVWGASEKGDHPNPQEFLVCGKHNYTNKEAFKDRANTIFEELRGWVCQACYTDFGNQRVANGMNRQRNDERTTCMCKDKFTNSTLCFVHEKKSYEIIESRVRRYHAATMARFSYRVCGGCLKNEGSDGFGVWQCIGCHEICWEQARGYR